LLAELLAQRRRPGSARVAVPVRRGWTDVVPRWALVPHSLAALGAVVLPGLALAGVGWARRWYPGWASRTLWLVLGVAVLSVVVVWVIVGLALRRPTVAEARVDPLLRTRSGRVSVGLGIASLYALIGSGGSDFRGLIVAVVGLVCWSMIAGPVRA
jgi:hypothetical protein